MKIAPPKRTQEARPVALLRPGHRVLDVQTIDGRNVYRGARKCSDGLAALNGHCCYVLEDLSSMRHTTGAMGWQCHLWRGRETRMVHALTGTTVVSLRRVLNDSDDPWHDLSIVHDWLSTYGVGPGSIPSMAWGLFRASLPHEFTIGFDPEISSLAMYGGRQQAFQTGVITNAVSYDVQAAYPVAMASRDYALSLSPVHIKSTLDPEASGLAEATIFVPDDMPYAPLPVRLAPGYISFQHGRIEGIWPWCEVAAARALGCDVRITRLWAPRRTADLFGSWWPMVAEGRALPGAAAKLAKAIANSTWGQFGMKGEERSIRQWLDESTFYDTPEPERAMPHEWTAHVAAETTARIRTRMLLEGLYGSCRPLHCDTDGLIIDNDGSTPANIGDKPGQWSKGVELPTVDIRGPQLYRWSCGAACGVDHAEWHYNAAGIPVDEAPAFFAASSSGFEVSWVRDFGDPRLAEVASRARLSMVSEW